MPLTLRQIKGSALTHNELDANFTYLESQIPSPNGLSATVAIDNNVGPSDLNMDPGYHIKSIESGTGIISEIAFVPKTSYFLDQSDLNTNGFIRFDLGASNNDLHEVIMEVIDTNTNTDATVKAVVDQANGYTLVQLIADYINLVGLPVYNDNSSAVSNGVPVDCIYATPTGELRIVI